MLVRVNPSDSARLAVEWLAANVCTTRLDIVCAFLVGLWTPDAGLDPPSLDVVLRLASLRPAERTTPDADYSYAVALARVLESRGAQIETAVIASQQLEFAAIRGTGDRAWIRASFR